MVETLLALVAGLGLGFALCVVYRDRRVGRDDERHQNSLMVVAEAAEERCRQLTEAHDKRVEELQGLSTSRESQFEEAYAQLLEQFHGSQAMIARLSLPKEEAGPHPTQSATSDADLQEQTDTVLGEGQTAFDMQVARLVEGGWPPDKAKRYLSGELPDDELPDLGEKLDGMVTQAVESMTGLPIGGLADHARSP